MKVDISLATVGKFCTKHFWATHLFFQLPFYSHWFVSFVVKLLPGDFVCLLCGQTFTRSDAPAGTRKSTLLSLWLGKFCVKASPVNNFFLFCHKTEVREERAGFHMEQQLLITKTKKKAGVLFDSGRGLERNTQEHLMEGDTGSLRSIVWV